MQKQMNWTLLLNLYKMNKIKVSIIIPAFNAGEYIQNSIMSVINQTYRNFEIIVIDDGSTDSTVEEIVKIHHSFPDVDIKIIKQANLGPSKTRNNGIKIARGDLIAFLDSDDEWYSHKLESIVKVFENDVDLSLLGSYYSIGDNSIFSEKPNRVRQIQLNRLLIKNYFITSATVCRTEVLKQFQFTESQKYSEDYRLWLEICGNGFKCCVLEECLVKLCDKPVYGFIGLSSRLADMEKGEIKNFIFLYKNGLINFIQFLSSLMFSVFKYFKRYTLTWIKKNIIK